jgi:hypothetical protein
MTLALLLLAQILTLFLLSRALQRQLSLLFARSTGSPKAAMWLMAFLFLPGTLMHELSHLVMAMLLLVRTGRLTVWPRMEADRLVMGSVQVAQPDRLRRLLIGVAPGLVGISLIFGALWAYQTYGLGTSWYWTVGLGYLIFQLGNTLFSSRADLEGALGLLVVVVITAGILYWMGARPDVAWVVPLLTQYEQILLYAVRFLCVPLVIDVVMVMAVWGMRKALRL